MHMEIPIDNPERAKSFYKELFGWNNLKLPIPMQYWMLDAGTPKDSRGGLISREERTKFKGINSSQSIINYIFVKNIEQYEKQIKQLGGKIITPTTDVKAGKFLIFRDSENNVLGLWEQAPIYNELIKPQTN